MNYNGTTSEVFWRFKDTIGGTKVTWRTKGNLSFALKINGDISARIPVIKTLLK